MTEFECCEDPDRLGAARGCALAATLGLIAWVAILYFFL